MSLRSFRFGHTFACSFAAAAFSAAFLRAGETRRVGVPFGNCFSHLPLQLQHPVAQLGGPLEVELFGG